jgi:hypothetical protein
MRPIRDCPTERLLSWPAHPMLSPKTDMCDACSQCNLLCKRLQPQRSLDARDSNAAEGTRAQSCLQNLYSRRAVRDKPKWLKRPLRRPSHKVAIPSARALRASHDAGSITRCRSIFDLSHNFGSRRGFLAGPFRRPTCPEATCAGPWSANAARRPGYPAGAGVCGRRGCTGSRLNQPSRYFSWICRGPASYAA